MASFFHWQFIESPTVNGRRWIWQRITIDGSIAERSKEFNDYGAAVFHAVQSAGFRPKSEGWTIITLNGVTHFRPDTTAHKSQNRQNKSKVAEGQRLKR